VLSKVWYGKNSSFCVRCFTYNQSLRTISSINTLPYKRIGISNIKGIRKTRKIFRGIKNWKDIWRSKFLGIRAFFNE